MSAVAPCLEATMRHLGIASLFLVVALGCTPHSDLPLTSPQSSGIDREILGTWYWQEEKETLYVHVGLDVESKLLRVVTLQFREDGAVERAEFSGHTSLLEGKKYLNLKWESGSGSEPGYMFIKYVVNQDTAGFVLMDSAAARTAIQNGLLKGEVTEENSASSVRITDGQENLQQFILQKDRALFAEMQSLHRLRLPNKP